MPKKLSSYRKVLLLALVFFTATQTIGFELKATSEEIKGILGDKTGIAVIRSDKTGTERLIVVMLPGLENYVLATEKTKTSNVRISPDGKYVLYLVEQPNDVMVVRPIVQGSVERWVLGPGFNPHWWVDPVTKEQHVIYASKNQSLLTTNYDGITYRSKFMDGGLQGSAEVLLNQGYKAGLSRDGRWLGTADKTPFLYDLQNKKPYELKISRNSTCHARMNPTVETSRMDQVCYINTLHDTLVTKNSRDSAVWVFPFADAGLGTFSTGGSKWHANNWSNYEDLMLTAAVLAPGEKYNSGTVKQYFMVLVRRSDKKLAVLSQGGPWQDLWIAEAPLYMGPVNIKGTFIRNKPGGQARTSKAFDFMGRSMDVTGTGVKHSGPIHFRYQ